VDNLCASALSSDDRVTDLTTKYKAIQVAVHVRISVYTSTYLYIYIFEKFVLWLCVWQWDGTELNQNLLTCHIIYSQYSYSCCSVLLFSLWCCL